MTHPCSVIVGVVLKVLYETDRYLVSAGGEGAPIVTFQSYREDQGIEAYRNKPWGAGFLEICGYSWVAIQPSFNDWYQSEEIAKIAKKTKQHFGGRRPILYGSSMGGTPPISIQRFLTQLVGFPLCLSMSPTQISSWRRAG
jgi:hypothetical protein